MKNKCMLLAIALILSSVSIMASAQNSYCRSSVSVLKSKSSSADSRLRIATNQSTNFDNRIASLTQQSLVSIENLQEKEALANTDFASVAACYGFTVFGGQWCSPSGIHCVTTTQGCASLGVSLGLAKQRAKVARQTAQKNWASRIAVIQKQKNLVDAKIPALQAASDAAQSSYQAAADKCDSTLAQNACITQQTNTCNAANRSCKSDQNSCVNQGFSDCNSSGQSSTIKAQCRTNIRASCLATYTNSCYNNNCKGTATAACPLN